MATSARRPRRSRRRFEVCFFIGSAALNRLTAADCPTRFRCRFLPRPFVSAFRPEGLDIAYLRSARGLTQRLARSDRKGGGEGVLCDQSDRPRPPLLPFPQLLDQQNALRKVLAG
ncbi:hypothetical protein AAFG13_42610 [Bradyrhizobium sp. B124]|uniref:hypothetical protein n=1 Tax=Bradyrhizobium sp. B124 TaxID=3140245 RepID=UPI003182DB10